MNRTRKDIKKKYYALLMLVGLSALFFCGCKGKPDENGSLTNEDGRSYGGVIEVENGQKAKTAFFDVKVESAQKYSTYQFDDGLYEANDGDTYLVVEVTVHNTYGKDLPMSITDFVMDYDGNKNDQKILGYGSSDLNDPDFMENLFTLKDGQSVTKKILYTIKDKKNYTMTYTEYYEDKLEGNTFKVNIQPK